MNIIIIFPFFCSTALVRLKKTIFLKFFNLFYKYYILIDLETGFSKNTPGWFGNVGTIRNIWIKFANRKRCIYRIYYIIYKSFLISASGIFMLYSFKFRKFEKL